MKKLLVLSTLLLTLSLSACNLTPKKDSSSSLDTESSEEEESYEDQYFGYPNDPEGYNLPKYATYDVYFESDANSNGSHDVHTSYDYHVIINEDEIYSMQYPDDENHIAQWYMKGRYIAGTEEMSHIHTWNYDIYLEPLNDDDIAMVGAGWKHLLTGGTQFAMNYIGPRYFFDYSNISERSSEKTGKSKLIDGEQCDEYLCTYWGGHYFYYSKKDQIIKGFRYGEEVDYQYYYILNYKTEKVDIPAKPGPDVLVA